MKTIVLFLYLLFCLSPLTSSVSQEKHVAKSKNQIKVAAYNVEFSDKGSAQEIGKALKAYDFDIICFSEAPAGKWTKEVADVLGMKHTVMGRYSTAGHKDKYKHIVSKTPLYGYEEVLMADTLHTVTKAFTKIKGQEYAVYAVHFPFGWRDQAHIDETTGKVTAFVDYLQKNQSDDIIPLVMGDFNFRLSNKDYESQYYEMFKKLGLQSTWSALGVDVSDKGTMVKYQSKHDGIGGVIDHIIYDPDKMEAKEGEIIEMEKPLSDHKPVWALLELK